jgi:hypothetical protein
VDDAPVLTHFALKLVPALVSLRVLQHLLSIPSAMLQSGSWQEQTCQKHAKEVAQEDQEPRRLSHLGHMLQETQEAQGLILGGPPEPCQGLSVYRRTHGAAPGALHGQLSIQIVHPTSSYTCYTQCLVPPTPSYPGLNSLIIP